MLIVGELINSSRKSIHENLEKRNTEYLLDIAKKQSEAGADYIDINCSTMMDKESEAMKWLVENIQEVVDIPLSIDTPNPLAMETGLSLAKKGQPMVNSITGEEKSYRPVLPIIAKYKAKVVALCIDEHGMPENAQDRLRAANKLVKLLTEAGLPPEDIYLDPVIVPVGTSDNAGIEVLRAIQLIKKDCPGVNLICGLSNISYGLPNRKVLNRVFMIQTLTMGMDAYILNPLDNKIMGDLFAAQALLGQDSYCTNYLSAHRKRLYEE
ncbi:methyltetrahydrofolate cobalamin methyltransferase [Chloroflexota bacterium]